MKDPCSLITIDDSIPGHCSQKLLDGAGPSLSRRICEMNFAGYQVVSGLEYSNKTSRALKHGHPDTSVRRHSTQFPGNLNRGTSIQGNEIVTHKGGQSLFFI
jgi:hypothetical protein